MVVVGYEMDWNGCVIENERTEMGGEYLCKSLRMRMLLDG